MDKFPKLISCPTFQGSSIKDKGSITNREYREIIGISDEGARLDLKKLVEKGILEVRGKGRSVYYIVRKLGN